MSSSYARLALDYFHEGYSCAQAVLVAFAEEAGLTRDQALRIAAPFGAGIGRMRGICGAFSGVTMLSGLLYGNTTPSPMEKEFIFQKVRDMADEFKTAYGTLECRDLLQLESGLMESSLPNERTADYYAARPCESCVAFCAEQGERLMREYREQSSRNSL